MQCGRSMRLTIMQQKHTQHHPSSRTSRHPLWLLSGFWFCVVVSIAVVLRRLNDLIRPSHGRPPQMAAIDATFSSHPVLTVMHIIPATIFVVLAAGILLRRAGGEWLPRNRRLGCRRRHDRRDRVRDEFSHGASYPLPLFLLGIATTRPVMGVFFATSGRTHLGPNQFFGMAFWIGFSINAVVTELWLHSRRRAELHKPGLYFGRFVLSRSEHSLNVRS
jgi:hypothetical protein